MGDKISTMTHLDTHTTEVFYAAKCLPEISGKYLVYAVPRTTAEGYWTTMYFNTHDRRFYGAIGVQIYLWMRPPKVQIANGWLSLETEIIHNEQKGVAGSTVRI